MTQPHRAPAERGAIAEAEGTIRGCTSHSALALGPLPAGAPGACTVLQAP